MGAPPRLRAAAAVWALAVLCLGASAAVAAAAPRSDTVLVRVDEDASATARAQIGRSLDADAAHPLLAGWRAYELPGPVSAETARRLLEHVPAAEAVALDATVHAFEVPDDAHYAQQWALPRIGAPAAWDSVGAAAPVVVAVIDTGVATAHPDLAGRMWINTAETPGNGIDDDANGFVDDVGGWNFADHTSAVYSAADDDSHGTHVAGTIAARRGNGIGVAGIADNARIMPLKFLENGTGSTSDAIVAIQYAMDEGATIINASWGGASYSQPLCDAIGLAAAQGVLVVTAAGNAGTDNDAAPVYPANCPAPSMLSVAATTSSEGLAGYSNRGTISVDVGAPGDAILSTVPSGYSFTSGTSMAAPHASAVAAVVAGLHPGLTPMQLRSYLISGGTPLASLSGMTASGRRVDLAGAVSASGTPVAPDVAPPAPFSALLPAAGLVTTDALPVFRWTPSSDAYSGLAGYRVRLDGAVVAQPGPGATWATAPAPLSDGVHRWSVAAVDGAGNERGTEERILVIDRGAPSAPVLVVPAGGGRVASAGVDLSWMAAHDAVSGVAAYRVLMDGQGIATLPASARSARVTLARGEHVWQVSAIDAAGNQSTSASASFAVVPGITAPRALPRPSLRLSARARLARGRSPVLRVRLGRAARVTITVRRAGRSRAVATVHRRLRAGTTSLRLPARVVRRMRPAGAYLVLARAPGGLRDSVRLVVAPPRRR